MSGRPDYEAIQREATGPKNRRANPKKTSTEAAAELRRYVEDLGFVAGATSAHSAGRNLDHPDLYPFYQTGKELQVPGHRRQSMPRIMGANAKQLYGI